jgi:hypothetical protein
VLRLWQNALEIGLDIEARLIALDVLAGLAGHLSSRGDGGRERAVELLTFVQHHPASDHDTKERAWLLRESCDQSRKS